MFVVVVIILEISHSFPSSRTLLLLFCNNSNPNRPIRIHRNRRWNVPRRTSISSTTCIDGSMVFTLVVPAIVTPEPYHHDPHDKFRSRRPMFCTTVVHVHAVRYVAVENQQINVSVTLVDAFAASSLLVQTRAKPLRLRMSFHGTQDRK